MPITKILIKTWCILSAGFVVTLSLLALYAAWSVLSEIDHSQSMGEELFLLFGGNGLALFWMPLAWLIMSHVTPRAITDRYLKEPHFSAAEIIGRSIVSPLIPYPTTMFMAACTVPRNWLAAGWLRRRQMADLRDHAPRWFVWCSRIVYTGAVVHGLLWASLLIGLVIYGKFIDV